MADCNNLFHEFNSTIRLSDSRRQRLSDTRSILRQKIKTYFISNFPDQILKFQSQGSFVMDTIINPINEDYDLDDGVYWLGNLSKDERPSPTTVHNKVMDAIGDHTDNVIDKDTCIRVIYAEGFHIDLPMYYAQFLNSPDLAHKRDGWILSNPIEFVTWFENKANSGFDANFIYKDEMLEQFRGWIDTIRKKDVQLRRIIRYLKAWGDFKKGDMPPGIIMTILGTNSYHEDSRDDVAFLETLKNIKSRLDIRFECKRPTTPVGEDLFRDYSQARKDYFMNSLTSFIDSGKEAIENRNQKEACYKWQKHFGSRFSCAYAKDEIENATSFGSPAIIRGNAKSA